MSYSQQVLARMAHPGFIIMLLGALAVFAAGIFVRNVPSDKRDKVKLTIQGIGTAVIMLGAVILFTVS